MIMSGEKPSGGEYRGSAVVGDRALRAPRRYRRRRDCQSAPVLRAEISSPENTRAPVGSRSTVKLKRFQKN